MNSSKTDIFENAPIKRAVLSQIIPSVAAQMIVLLYNLADTFFVGRLNDPLQTASVTIAFPVFLMLQALANLFGIGGSSAIARALGKKQTKDATQISSISFWSGVAVSVLFSVLVLCFSRSILNLCGAKPETFDIGYEYVKWTVMIGGPFTVLSAMMTHIVRSEGGASAAFFGVTFGGVLNIIIDPFFVLPQFLGFKAAGAGMATAISNFASTAFFLIYILKKRGVSVLSINPKLLRYTKKHIKNIVSIGLPSALQYALTVVAATAQARFVAEHRITEAIAGLGIITKIQQLPLFVSIGVSSGLLPLLAYNHASGNLERRKKAFSFGVFISVGFAVLCLITYEIFAPNLVGLFIKDEKTIEYGAAFLRIIVTAMPLMAVCYPMIIQFQAMGRAKESLICSVLRKGVLDIPLLFLLDSLWPLFGCLLVQPIIDTISIVVELLIYRKIKRSENAQIPA